MATYNNRKPVPYNVRLAVYQRARYLCEDCGESKKLDMHHLRYTINDGHKIIDECIFGKETADDLVALCRDCHYARHRDINGDYWRDPEEMEERILYWEFGKQAGDPNSGIIGEIFQAARRGKWKAVRYGIEAPVELYDIEEDPAESNELSAEWPDVHQEFVDLFEKHKG